MALVPSGSGGAPVIAEVEMNGAADQSATTVRATVVQASTVFYDTPATLGAAMEQDRYDRERFDFLDPASSCLATAAATVNTPNCGGDRLRITVAIERSL